MALNLDDDKTLTAIARTMDQIQLEARKLNVEASDYADVVRAFFNAKARIEIAKSAIAKASSLTTQQQ